MFMLRNRAPERFAGGKAQAPNAVDKMQLARLKKQWREEWERQHAAESAAQTSERGDPCSHGSTPCTAAGSPASAPRPAPPTAAFREAEAAEPLARREQDDDDRDAEARKAEAEYAEWFNEERRAKIGWVIDVVFGAVSEAGGEEGA